MNKDVIYQGNQKLTIELRQGTTLASRQIDSIFQLGLWKFNSENQLTFQPKTTLFDRLFPLTATYKKIGKAYRFQAEEVVEFEKVFLDGIIQIEGKSLILDTIYSLSTPSEPLQIARIIQKLDPTSLSIDKFERYRKSVINSSMESEESLTIINNEQFKLEIDTFPIIKNYRVLLAGKTDSESFRSLVAYLFVSFSLEEEIPDNIQLISKITSDLQHGTLNWNCQLLEQFLDNNCYSLTKTNKGNYQILNIKLNYQEKLPTTNCTWYSRPENELEANIIVVMGENVSVNLTIDGDRVIGDISASGYYTDSLAPSTYQATIVGEIERSKQVEKLRQQLNSENSIFTGCWLTEIETIGQIKLEQNGNKVQGNYQPLGKVVEGKIVGIAEENFLEFQWTNGKQQGWGYLRSLNQGGTLSGVWGIGDFPLNSQTIIANWQLPINVEAASQDDEIFLREFRWLGHELVNQGRFEQGVTVLEEVLSLYRYQRHQLNISSQDGLNYLHNEAFTLVSYVLRGNIYLSEYNKLLTNLDHLLEVIQLLGAEESASRLFKERTASIKKSLIDFIQSCQIFVEEFQKTKLLLETEVHQPELLDIIDYLEKYFTKLTILTETELDNLEQLNLDISQARIDFLEAWTILTNCLAVLREKINLKIEEFLKLKETIFVEYPSFLEDVNLAIAFVMQLGKNLNNQNNITTSASQDQVIDSQDNSISLDLDTILDLEKYSIENLDISEIVELDKKIESFILKNNNLASIKSDEINPIEIDKKIENFFLKNTDLSYIETVLFRSYLNSFELLNNFLLNINLEHNFLSKIDIVKNFEENQQNSRTMLSNLTHHLERWRGKLVDDLEKIDALEQAQPLFTKILEISVALGDANEALILSEKSRARAFADMLATRFHQDLNRDLINFPITSTEINFDQIQQLAQAYSATIVEYFVVTQGEKETKVYIWVVQPNGSTILKTVELNYGSQQQNYFLSNLVIRARESFGVRHSETFGNSLHQFSANTEYFPNLGSSIELGKSQTVLAELYQLLIEPIESFLKTSSSRKIILIPHGTLFLIPFATLLNSTTKQYLIEHYSIILSPSIQTLNLTHQNFIPTREAQNVLVVGNPQMPSFDDSPQLLPQLPYTETVAKAIANLFKTKSLVGKQATKREILTQLPQAKIIHFGTHGKFDDLQPLKSGIALAPEGEEGGFLTVGDILAHFAPPQTLSLTAELVVLSACSTGLGRITGDGVIGLARGLMAAGVKAVLVSIWEVQDFPTACLMLQFYKYLQVGNASSEALKQAQVWLKDITNKELLEWLRQEKFSLNSMQKQRLKNQLEQEKKKENIYPFRHPYYWGAFYLIGA